MRDPENPGAYLLEAEFDDASGVAKVEFLLNDEPVGTDYGGRSTPSRTTGQSDMPTEASAVATLLTKYSTPFSPTKLGYTRDTFLSRLETTVDHTVKVVVTTYDRTVSYEYTTVAQAYSTSEPIGVDLAILNPPPDHKIYIDGAATPPGTVRMVNAHAVQYDFACEYGAGALTLTPDCTEVMRPVADVQIYFDGELVKHFVPGAGVYDFEQYIDVGNLTPGEYWIEVQVHDTEDKLYYESSPIEVVQQVPSLDVTRHVQRIDNAFRVQLNVQNVGVVPLMLSQVKDSVRSFQVATAGSSSYRVSADYVSWAGSNARINNITIDFPDQSQGLYALNPGTSVLLEYLVLPVLYETAADYQIGQKNVEVRYQDSAGLQRLATFSRPEPMLASNVALAQGEAAYLIVTHPSSLNGENEYSVEVDRLLMTMADLALEKRGALGYLESVNPREILDELVSLPAGGAWANALHPVFNT
ncbi:MAG: hypothetical protein ACP5JJ_07115, partial [Anaerolineae bacterium]